MFEITAKGISDNCWLCDLEDDCEKRKSLSKLSKEISNFLRNELTDKKYNIEHFRKVNLIMKCPNLNEDN